MPRPRLARCAGILLILLLPAAVARPESPPKAAPLLVGGAAHGREYIAALSDLGVGNFVWIPKRCDPTSPAPWDDRQDILADVDACTERGLSFLISQRRGLGREWKLGGFEYGGDTETELYPSQTIREIARRAGRLFAGLHAEEMDADLLQTAFRVPARTRLPDLYRFTDRAGGRRSFEAELARIARLYHGYAPGVRYCPNMCVSLQHSGFRAGGDLVLAELLESLPCTEMQLAYLRGGGRQFGRDWGVWVSPWYRGKVPCEDKSLWTLPHAQPGAGHTASALRRCLYLAYGSGARLLTVQQTEPLLNRAPGGGYRLAAWGRELKSFWDYARQRPEPLTPLVSLALLVDRDNGWAPGHLHGDWLRHETIWGKLPVERADAMLAAYLDVLMPGFERNAPDWWQKEGLTYPGYFASTPGGAFDIVSSDISAERLASYPNVALMADVEMTPALLRTLQAYVRGGGRLLLNACQMRRREALVQAPAFLGATIGMSGYQNKDIPQWLSTRRVYVANRIVRRQPLPGVTQAESVEPWYAALDVQPATAETLADDGEGHPLLLRQRYGRGWVYLSTPEYQMEGFNDFRRPLGFFAALLLGMARSGPLQVTGESGDDPPPDVSWVAARQGDSVLVTLVNHGAAARTATVRWSGGAATAALEVGGPLETGPTPGGAAWRVRIGPEDVAVLRLSGGAVGVGR